MASVRVRTATGLGFVLLVVLDLLLADRLRPGIVAWVTGAILAALAAHELGRLGRLGGARRRATFLFTAAVGAGGLLVVVLEGTTPWGAVGWTLGIQAVVFTIAAALGRHEMPDDAGEPAERAPAWLCGPFGSGVLAAWSGPPLVALGLVHLVHGTTALATLLVLSKIGDVAGYFVGKAIGKSHPFPRLSPGKTTAGCVASLIAGSVAGLLAGVWGFLPGDGGALLGALAGALLNVAAQAADLFESRVKRAAAVKDSGRMAGASGGVLDVVDSLLFTIPVGLVLFATLAT